MKGTARKISAAITAVLLILNLILFGLGMITPTGFWLIIGAGFLFSWYLNKHKP